MLNNIHYKLTNFKTIQQEQLSHDFSAFAFHFGQSGILDLAERRVFDMIPVNSTTKVHI